MNESWVDTVVRGRWVESLLATAAVVAVAWPLGELLSSRPWIDPLAGVLLLVVVVGSLVRMARVPAWLVLMAQVVALLSGLAWWAQTYRPDGESALTAAHALVDEGVLIIQSYAVPAPATAGVTFIVLAGTALLALLVEALGVTLRAAAVAGVPLLLVSAAAASGSGQALDPRYFVLAAAAWLALLALQSRSGLEEWRAAGAASTSTTMDRDASSRGSRRLSVTARVMGLSALVLAVVVPGLLPHLPPTVLLDGRSGEGAPGSVSFTETLNLAQDLADRSNAPVIRYRTDDSSPPPLRVTASAHYADGSWEPALHAGQYQVTDEGIWTINSALLEANGLEATSATITVTQNGMRAPQLALPHPTRALDLGEIDWQWSPYADVARVDTAPGSYEATYFEVAPLTTLPEEIGAPPVLLLDEQEVEYTEERDGVSVRYGRDDELLEVVDPDGGRRQAMSDGSARIVAPDGSVRRSARHLDPTADPLAVDPASEDLVRPLAEELAGDHTNQIDIATEFQRYLRGPDFSYSLTLADPVVDEDGEPLDPISHFLETRQGYCTQFATAMVMLARAQDIPARLAVGFLPGTQGLDGTRTVVASDAHAWPELFINGLGWTRFEPTPGARSGTAPFYPTTGQQEEVPTPAADPTVEEPTLDQAVPDTATDAGGRSELGWFERHGETIGWTALGLAAAAAALAVVPLAARWRRWRLRRGRGAAAQVEGEWSVLVTGLADLGVHPPRAATPRALREHYTERVQPDPPTLDALTRATDRLETARYAAQAPRLGTMREDVRLVLEWSRLRASRRQRLLATLLPGDGRAQLRVLLPGQRRPVDPAPAGSY